MIFPIDALLSLPGFLLEAHRRSRGTLGTSWIEARRRFSLRAYLQAASSAPGRLPRAWELWWAFKAAMGMSRGVNDQDYLEQCMRLIETGERTLSPEMAAAAGGIPSMAMFRGFVTVGEALNGRRDEFRHLVVAPLDPARPHWFSRDDSEVAPILWDLLHRCARECKGAWHLAFFGQIEISFAKREDAMLFAMTLPGARLGDMHGFKCGTDVRPYEPSAQERLDLLLARA